MPNRKVFDSVCTYLIERGANELNYWRAGQTTKHTYFKDKGFFNKPGIKRQLSVEEFFLVLVRLKTGYFASQLSFLFNISRSQVGVIFTTWVNFLSIELKLLFEMPQYSDETVAAKCYQSFPGLKVILDCLELETQTANILQAKKELYSNYKSRTTLKFLIGMSPDLCITYVSKCWGGRASDKKITLSSDKLLNAIPSSSSIMTDRGFDIGDNLKKLGISLIIPAFKGRNRSQLSKLECQNSENIAKARIYVERIIHSIHTFHILDHKAFLSIKDILEQTFITCAYLTNFQSPIIR